MFGLNQVKYSSITYSDKNGKHGYSKNQRPIHTIFSRISNNKLSVDYSDDIISIVGMIEYDSSLSFQSILNKEKSGQISCWDVTIPHGKFLGKIKFESKVITSETFVYQDKQHGNLPIQSFLNQWGWSVTVNNHITNGMFSILSKDNKPITIKFSCDGKTISKKTSTTFDKNWVDYLGKLWDAPHNDYRTKDFDVENIVIRKRIREKHDGFQMTYYRYVCKTDSSICGACEYMKIN